MRGAICGLVRRTWEEGLFVAWRGAFLGEFPLHVLYFHHGRSVDIMVVAGGINLHV
jgi:hypothetical protein